MKVVDSLIKRKSPYWRNVSDKNWEQCVNLLNRTVQNFAVAAGLTYIPYDIYTGLPASKFNPRHTFWKH